MTAPPRAPHYFSAIAGQEEDHDFYVGALIDDVASMPDWFPDWIVDNDKKIEVRLTLVEHEAAERAIVQWVAGGQVGTLTAARDPSGWLVLTAEHDGAEVFRGYVERIYEEYEVWPAGTNGEGIESPGRIGKKRSWASLPASVWPALGAIAENGWVNLQIDDDKLREQAAEERRFTTSDGVTLVYVDLGARDGVPVVLCHGLAAAGEQMRADADFFARRGYRVLLPDLRGHGRSGKPASMSPADFSVARMARDLCEMLDHAEAPPVHWVGNSLGGIVALEMLGTDSARLRTLATFGTSYSLGLPAWSGKVIRWGYGLLGKRLAATLTAMQTTRSIIARAMIEKLVATFDPRVGELVASQISRYDLIANATKAKLPILLLRGGLDRAVNRALAPTLAAMKGRENFSLVELPGGGHCANLDARDAWRAALLEFWAGR